jgi:endonuclease YncB( thermonuclease family)
MTARNSMPIWVFSKGKCYVDVRPSMRAWVIATVLTVATVAIAQTEPIDPSDINVLDGDTITVFKMQPNVRLVGFNAPETDRAVCPIERELGLKARDRLRALVGAGNLTFEYVDCSCPAKTQGTFACNYGRDCGTLKANGRDVGAILINDGLAVSFVCGPTSCPKTPRPWCR